MFPRVRGITARLWSGACWQRGDPRGRPRHHPPVDAISTSRRILARMRRSHSGSTRYTVFRSRRICTCTRWRSNPFLPGLGIRRRDVRPSEDGARSGSAHGRGPSASAVRHSPTARPPRVLLNSERPCSRYDLDRDQEAQTAGRHVPDVPPPSGHGSRETKPCRRVTHSSDEEPSPLSSPDRAWWPGARCIQHPPADLDPTKVEADGTEKEVAGFNNRIQLRTRGSGPIRVGGSRRRARIGKDRPATSGALPPSP